MKTRITSLVVILLLISLISGFSALLIGNRSGDNNNGSETDTGITDITTNTSDNITNTNPISDTTDKIPEKPIFDEDFTSKLSASQIFVYSISDSKFLYEKGTDKQIVPASITKLLTALYALEVMPHDSVITPKDELQLIGKGSSIAYITTSHKLTLEMLIEGMLLPSGNDAAYAVAAGVGRYLSGNKNMSGKDAVSLFMEKLNQYAKSIGCNETHFEVPDGLIYEGHYTTANDLVIIAKKAISNEIISKYARTVSDSVTYASGHFNTWKNTNLLINPESEFYRDSVNGLKTGSLNNAFSVLVTAKIDNRDYIIGIFGSPDTKLRFQDAANIIDLIKTCFQC